MNRGGGLTSPGWAAPACHALHELTDRRGGTGPACMGVLKGSRLTQQARGLSGSSKTPEASFPVSSTLLSGQKSKTDSPVPRRRLSQLRGGDPRFVEPELMLDLRGAGTSPGPRATCQTHRSPSLCPAAAPGTGGLLPDAAPGSQFPPPSPSAQKTALRSAPPAGRPWTRAPGAPSLSAHGLRGRGSLPAVLSPWISHSRGPIRPGNRLPALLAAPPHLSQTATPRRPSALPAPQLGSLARRRA